MRARALGLIGATARRATRRAESFSTSSKCASGTNSEFPLYSKSCTALYFPGQGTQRVGMLTKLQKAIPNVAGPLIEEMDATIAELPTHYSVVNKDPRKLSQIIADGPSELLTATENAQPAILATSVILLRALEAAGFETDKNVKYFLGHSLGEFSALVASGTLKFSDALRLVRVRGEIMTACAYSFRNDEDHELGMVALIVPADRMHNLLSSIRILLQDDPDEVLGGADRIVQLANINSSTQVVLSGHIKGIRTLLHRLRNWSGQDPRAIRLKVSAPFHSMIMSPSVRVVSEMLQEYELNFPSSDDREILSCSTGMPYDSKEQVLELLPLQAVQTVNWRACIDYLNCMEVSKWIGIGPGTKVGKNLIAQEVNSGVESIVTVGEDLDEKGFAELAKKLTKEING